MNCLIDGKHDESNVLSLEGDLWISFEGKQTSRGKHIHFQCVKITRTVSVIHIAVETAWRLNNCLLVHFKFFVCATLLIQRWGRKACANFIFRGEGRLIAWDAFKQIEVSYIYTYKTMPPLLVWWLFHFDSKVIFSCTIEVPSVVAKWEVYDC